MSEFEFGNIESLKRKPEIEGETGSELGVGAGITLITLAASDANPRWRAGRGDMKNEIGRLANAEASPKRVREYLAGEYSRRLIIGWYYTDDSEKRHVGPLDPNGNPIPFSSDACKAFLVAADDAFTKLEGMVYDTTNFRGRRIEAVIETGKD